MKQLPWPWAHTLWHKGRRLFLLLAGILVFWMIVMLSTSHLLGFQGPTKPHLANTALAFSMGALTPPGTDVDPTMLIGQPQLFDARPCVADPTDTHCTGVYPAIPPHIDMALATSQGAGACFDRNSVPLSEPQDTIPNVGQLQLWYYPLCQSYAAQFILALPASQVSTIRVSVNQESTNGFLQWVQRFNQLPPPIQATQTSQPQPFEQLLASEQQFYERNGLFSPLLYSPSNSANAEVSLTLVDGTGYLIDTNFYMGTTKTDNFVQ